MCSTHIDSFDIGYRKKRGATNQSFRVNSEALDGATPRIFTRRLHKPASKGGRRESKSSEKRRTDRLRLSKRDLRKFLNVDGGRAGEVDADFTILKTRPGMWYLCLPRRRVARVLPACATAAYRSVFLDPGVRTFMTLYSPDGVYGKLGGTVSDELKVLAARHDMLQGASTRAAQLRAARKPRRRRERGAWGRQTGGGRGVPREPRGTSWRAAPSSGQRCGARWTTCTPRRAAKVFRCPHCAFVADRDVAAARNICLKVLTECLTGQ